jgi:hypothetical protein
MSQSTLLDSKEKTGKFSVSVERVVNLGNYETLRIGLAEVIDGTERPEDAYTRILEKVNGWTSQLKPAKPEPLVTAITKTTASEKLREPAIKHPVPVSPQPVKTELTIGKEDHYLTLPWKQSQKKQNLGTILVTTELLQNPLARDLYDKVKEWKRLKVGQVTYCYSQMENGTEFLQKWSPVKLG